MKNLRVLLPTLVPVVIAVVAYLLQVDPLSLCKGTLPPVAAPTLQQPDGADAGQ